MPGSEWAIRDIKHGKTYWFDTWEKMADFVSGKEYLKNKWSGCLYFSGNWTDAEKLKEYEKYEKEAYEQESIKKEFPQSNNGTSEKPAESAENARRY